MNKFKRIGSATCLAAAGISVLAWLGPVPALAIDVSPGDYSVLPSGTTLGALYFQYSTSNTFHLDGVGKVANSKSVSAVGLLRGLHYSDIAGLPVLYQAILPIGAISTARIGGVDQGVSDGVGDLSLGFTVYPIHSDDPTGTTIGLTGFVTAPTGAYDSKNISLGSGTWTFTPQIGVQQGLGKGFFFDTYLDVAFQLDHTENGQTISKDPSVELQTYLRYQFDRKTSVSFGYAGQFGGKSKVDDVYNGLKTRSDQLRIFANTFVTSSVQLQAMLGTDVYAEGGYKQGFTTQLRLLKVF